MNLMHAFSHNDRATFLRVFFLKLFVVSLNDSVNFFLIKITRQIHYNDMFIRVNKEYQMTASSCAAADQVKIELMISFKWLPRESFIAL